ncbi:MAG TPA: hypothetical protein VIC62_18755 [Nakamurella sp.]
MAEVTGQVDVAVGQQSVGQVDQGVGAAGADPPVVAGDAGGAGGQQGH